MDRDTFDGDEDALASPAAAGSEERRAEPPNSVADVARKVAKMSRAQLEALSRQVGEFPSLVDSLHKGAQAELARLNTSNDEQARQLSAHVETILAAHGRMLDRDDLSPEQRMQVLTDMRDVMGMLLDADRENKRFLGAQRESVITVLKGAGVLALSGVAIAVAIVTNENKGK